MLKEILRAKGIKQAYVAQRLGVSVVTVSNWVNEKATPSKKHLEKLCRLLNVLPKDIINQ